MAFGERERNFNEAVPGREGEIETRNEMDAGENIY